VQGSRKFSRIHLQNAFEARGPAATAAAAAIMLGHFERLNVPYAIFEGLVSMVTIAGNMLVLVAFKRERKLRRRTNYYIVSLAVADLLVGLIGIPCAVLASIGLPRQMHACLFSVSLLIVLCTISIFSLVAVSLDRYWAILHPMSYSRNVNSKFALGKYVGSLHSIVSVLQRVSRIHV